MRAIKNADRSVQNRVAQPSRLCVFERGKGVVSEVILTLKKLMSQICWVPRLRGFRNVGLFDTRRAKIPVALKPQVTSSAFLNLFRRAIPSEQLRQVRRKRRARQDGIAPRLLRLELQVALHVRDEPQN